MIANLGLTAIVVAFACTLYASGTSVYGAVSRKSHWVDSARNAATVVWPLLTLAALMLIASLVLGDFSLAYVVKVSQRDMPVYLKVTALWGGMEGSLLFWSWLMSTFIFGVMIRKWREDRVFMPYVIAVTMLTEAFFLFLVLFVANPFARLAVPEVDGQGLNPLLRHPGMIIHPPMLYLGFVGFTIPYAFAMAALISGRGADDAWIRTTRRWTIVAWMFLSFGLLLGARWAYDVLGWGGYWGWDPVENAALMPWLVGTAFLHSVMIQEKRGMLKIWNMVLVILAYLLVILGTFLTRSGVISSVHAFTNGPIGPLFFGFIAIAMIASVALLIWRWQDLSSESQMDSLLSREAAFMLNNLLFLSIAVAVFWGTVFPILSELFSGTKITVGPPFYNSVVGPLAAVLVVLMGIAPLIAWHHSSVQRLGKMIWKPAVAGLLFVAVVAVSGVRNPLALIGYYVAFFSGTLTLIEYWRGVRARQHNSGESIFTALSHLVARNRRRYGGYLIHLGVVIMAFGVVGQHFFQQQTQGSVAVGESLNIAGYTITYENLRQYMSPDQSDLQITEATATVYQNGQPVATLYPRQETYLKTQQPMTIPSTYYARLGTEDVYLLLVGWEPIGTGGATFKVFLNPLINFIWWGGIILGIGALTAAWPDAQEARRVVPATGRQPAVASGD